MNALCEETSGLTIFLNASFKIPPDKTTSTVKRKNADLFTSVKSFLNATNQTKPQYTDKNLSKQIHVIFQQISIIDFIALQHEGHITQH